MSEKQQIILYRIDLKNGEVAHALDHRNYPTLCAELLKTREVLASVEKEHPDPFENLQLATREAGWLFLQTGMWEVKKIEGISVEVCPPPEHQDWLEAQRESQEEIHDDEDVLLD